MSDTAGYVLLAAAAVPTLIGWSLSAKGLSKVETAATVARDAATETARTVATLQPAIAEMTGAPANAVADSTSELVKSNATLTNGIDDVSSALKEMTGRLAPARVCFALTFLLVLGALVALDVLTVGT